MTLKIHKAPRLDESTTASDVIAEWIVRAQAAKTVTPRSDEPYRAIHIPEDEWIAFCNYLIASDENDDVFAAALFGAVSWLHTPPPKAAQESEE